MVGRIPVKKNQNFITYHIHHTHIHTNTHTHAHIHTHTHTHTYIYSIKIIRNIRVKVICINTPSSFVGLLPKAVDVYYYITLGNRHTAYPHLCNTNVSIVSLVKERM